MTVTYLSKKSDFVTVRLEPRLRFALDMLARTHRGTMTSILEWALDRAIKDPEHGLPERFLDEVWNPYEADRFVKLAMLQPDLLRFKEDLLWQAIKDDASLWRGRNPDYQAIREQWGKLKTKFSVRF